MQVSLLARTRCMVIAMYAKYEHRRRSVVVASKASTITDPLRGSTHSLFLSPSCAQSLCDFRLHGVSHDAASPMPLASNFVWFRDCTIRISKLNAFPTKFLLFRKIIYSFYVGLLENKRQRKFAASLFFLI